jgi:hypothetical protein
MAINPRRDSPLSGDTADLEELLRQTREQLTELRTAATRGLPPGFVWQVTRLADGTAEVAILDRTRNISHTIGTW